MSDDPTWLEPVRQWLEVTFGDKKAEGLIAVGLGLPDFKQKEFFLSLIDDFESEGKTTASALVKMSSYKFQPVDVETFVRDPYYLNLGDTIYPAVMDALIEMNSGKYEEAVLTGGIGSAKTTIAILSTAYQLYLVSALRDPQGSFGLDRSAEILFVMQSIDLGQAKEVSYGRFRALIEGCTYFVKNFPFRKDLESTLKFDGRIEVRPIGGSESSAIGQNVIGGIIDEVNFMDVVASSKRSIDGGAYNQADALYDSLARRRESRFMQGGGMPGLLCLVSSKRYPGQFTDKKQEEAKTDPSIYVYDQVVWNIKPEGTFLGEWFRIYTGDLHHKPRIMEGDEDAPHGQEHLVMSIPVEYRKQFDRDIYSALRDIAGVSTLASHPFITNRDLATACFGRTESILSRTEVDFVSTQLAVDRKKIRHHQKPRWVHLDLALAHDGAGVSMGYVDQFVDVVRAEEHANPLIETLPKIVIDFTLRVTAPPSGEIQFHKIRSLVMMLRNVMGINVRWVTMDGFQSSDTKQLLRQQGLKTGEISMDRTSTAYELTKSAMYDSRLDLPEDERAMKEFNQLERDPITGKIDHPATNEGSKDVSDSVAGVVMGLSTQREVWALYKVPMRNIPKSIQTALAKDTRVRSATADEQTALNIA